MRCPKCHYLSFEPEHRCRNCGYDFSLAEGEPLLKARDEVAGPFADLELRPAAPAPAQASSASPVPAPAATVSTSPAPAAAMPAVAPTVGASPRVVTTDLPLFMRGMPEPASSMAADEPLVAAPVAARPPLSVRRRVVDPAPSPSMAPATKVASAVALKKPVTSASIEGEPVWAAIPAASTPLLGATPPAAESEMSDPLPKKRLVAALVDASLLLGIDAMILWFTLRLCALTIGQTFTLPLIPLGAFCAFIDVGYLLMFTTAHGQTLGKMMTGLRVVDDTDADPQERPTARQAVLRVLLSVPSVLAVGLGFLPAMIGRGLALHDRLSHTRVVRA